MVDIQVEALLRLFKAYIANDLPVSKTGDIPNESSIYKGIVYDSPFVYENVARIAEIMYGKSSEQWNQTFHKSFSTVRDTPIETLIGQQLIHYFSTYGLESLGIYDSNLVYVPKEQLDIPELEEDVPLIVIHRINSVELTEKLMTLLTSGITLSKQTIEDIKVLGEYIPKERVFEVENREVLTYLMDKYNILPLDPKEFLRYFLYKVTRRTLLINDKETILAIKEADIKLIHKYLSEYVITQPFERGREKLASIYFRYRKLFLAMKRNAQNYDTLSPEINEVIWVNNLINKISRMADKYKVKADVSILQKLTDTNYTFRKDTLTKALDNNTVFRIIRIYNGLNYRCNSSSNSIVYKVRSGKAYVSTMNRLDTVELQTLKKRKDFIYDYLVTRVRNTVKDKTVYLPDNIVYTAPQSEKQFIDNLPQGSYVETKRHKNKNMLVGVHWTNLKNERVDLDLHMMDKNRQYGWNSSYRNKEDGIYFSGDVTDAPLPKGATEVFYISRNIESNAFLLTLNNYTTNKQDVPFQFMVAETIDTEIEKNYVVDPNNMLIQIGRKFDTNLDNGNRVYNITLGLCMVRSNYLRFYFNDFSLGSSIVTSRNEITTSAYEYLQEYGNTQLTLQQLLKDAGVNLQDEPNMKVMEEVEVDDEILYRATIKPVDYNLSYETITKESLIDLLTGGK